MATAQDVIDRARHLINDEASAFVSGLRWSDAEMLEWITDGEREIVQLKPEANAVTDWFDVVADFPRQRLDPEVAYRLIRVEANGTGTALSEATRPNLGGGENSAAQSIDLTWSAPAFINGETLASYELYRIDAQTLDSQISFNDPPTHEEIETLGQLIDTPSILDTTYQDVIGNQVSMQYAYFLRAIGSASTELDSYTDNPGIDALIISYFFG